MCCWSPTRRARDARELSRAPGGAASTTTASRSGCSPQEAADLGLDGGSATARAGRRDRRGRARLRARRRRRRRRVDPAGRRARARRRRTRAGRQHRSRRVPRRGRGRGRRRHDRGDRRAAATPPTSGSRSTCSVLHDGEVVARTFALNEASVEKAARERMLEVVLEIDGRPLSRWGCDGVVCATPTGSTAYNFSAGGPVVWPSVEALCVVPLSAHALFARPLVVAPTSVVAVEVLSQSDRRRRAVVRRPAHRRPAAGRPDRGTPRRAAGPAGAAPRGAVHRPAGGQVRALGRGVARSGRATPPRRGPTMLEEIRIEQLGVIDSSTLELGPGLTVITGETGAGKTMVVTALGLLLGGRADSGAVRTGAADGPGRGDGAARRGCPSVAAEVDEVGGEVEDDRVVLGRTVSAEGRSRAFAGGASVPDQPAGRAHRAAGGGARPVRPAPAAAPGGPAAPPSTGSPASTGRPTCWRATARSTTRCGPPSRSSTTSPPTPVTAPARPTCCGSASRRSGRSTRSRARTSSSRPRRRGSATPTRCGSRPRAPARRCRATSTGPTRSAPSPPPGPRSRACASTTRRRPSWPTGSPSCPTCLADLAADVASYASGLETDPARLAGGLRAAGGAGRAHPQVRRDHRRGAGLAAALGGAAARARRHRRADRGSCATPATGCTADLTAVADELSTARAEAARAAGRPGHRRAGRPRDAARAGRGRGGPARPVRQHRSRRRRVPAGRQRRQPTPARWPRAPPAASCRG